MSRDQGSRKGSDLGKALGDVARDQQQEAEAWWEGAARGDAGALPPGAPPVDELRPLDEAEQERLTLALFGALPATQVPVSPIPIQRRRAWLGPTAAALVALAAAVVLFLRPPPTVPAYRLEVLGGEVAVRGDRDAGGLHSIYRPGSRFEVVLVPEVPAETPLEVALFFEGPGGVQRYGGAIDRAPSGAFRLVAELGRDLDLSVGAWRLVAVLAPPGKLPAHLDGADRSHHSVLEHHFRVEGPDPPNDTPETPP